MRNVPRRDLYVTSHRRDESDSQSVRARKEGSLNARVIRVFGLVVVPFAGGLREEGGEGDGGGKSF